MRAYQLIFLIFRVFNLPAIIFKNYDSSRILLCSGVERYMFALFRLHIILQYHLLITSHLELLYDVCITPKHTHT